MPTPDLTGSPDAVLRLLMQPFEWRSRAVEELTLGSAQVCRSRRSLQVAPLGGLLYDEHPPSDARVLLPLQLLPKRPLLAWDVLADGKPAYLVKRGSTADIQAAHVVALAHKEGVELDSLTEQFVAAICEFTPSPWERFRQRVLWMDRWALRSYLEQGLGLLADEVPSSRIRRLRVRWTALAGRMEDQIAAWIRAIAPQLRGRWAWVDRQAPNRLALPRPTLRTWRRDALRSGRLLRSALGEGRQPLSSADNPLLALPLLLNRGAVRNIDEIGDAVARLAEVIETLTEGAGGSPHRSATLQTLAQYGRRWQVLVWAEVPLDRPFVVSTSQEVPIRVRLLRSIAHQKVPLNDALSNHVALRVADENVEVGRVEVRGVDRQQVPHTLASGVRLSREGFGLYSSEPDRDDQVTLRVHLRTATAVTIATQAVHAFTWASAGVLALLLYRESLTAEDLAVLVVPTTFAASLLLTRERTSLARRVQWKGRVGVVVGMITLWSLVTYAYLAERVS